MIALHDYQDPAVAELVSSNRGICHAPAGSGKTIIGAAAIAQWTLPRFLSRGQKIKAAWICNTMEQVAQGQSAVAAFPAIEAAADITFACYQSSLSLAGFELVILDECHHIAAPEFRKMLNYHEGIRWGLTATPNRDDDLKKDVFELIGPIVHVVERAALVDSGKLAKAIVMMLQPNRPKEMESAIAQAAGPEIERRMTRFGKFSGISEQEMKARVIWQYAQDIGIFENKARNDATVAMANAHANDSVLLLIGKIEHGEFLSERIPGSAVVHSKMGAKKRRAAIAAFGAGDLPCMIATSLADEGLDVPRANVLILAAGGRSAAKAEQRTGRVLRRFDGKTHGKIFDFMDVQHYFLLAQSKRRMGVYRQLGYNVSLPEEVRP